MELGAAALGEITLTQAIKANLTSLERARLLFWQYQTSAIGPLAFARHNEIQP
jgi:hypothetical protein